MTALGTNIDQFILSLILLVPLAGAVLVALLPDRAKLPNRIALLTSLATFVFTLHLPAHFISGQPGFQFEINIPWIAEPAISYHVGVDGLSLWLVVLVGLLAPVGVALLSRARRDGGILRLNGVGRYGPYWWLRLSTAAQPVTLLSHALWLSSNSGGAPVTPVPDRPEVPEVTDALTRLS